MEVINEYVDKILLYYYNWDIDLHNILKRLNKYYYAIISNNDNCKL